MNYVYVVYLAFGKIFGEDKEINYNEEVITVFDSQEKAEEYCKLFADYNKEKNCCILNKNKLTSELLTKIIHKFDSSVKLKAIDFNEDNILFICKEEVY